MTTNTEQASAINTAIFALESYAHLRGQEREILPVVDTARAERDHIVKVLEAAQRAIDIALFNKSTIPDPQMNGQADCYRVPLDDMDTLRSINVEIGATLRQVRP